MTNESQYINSVCRAIAIIELFFKLQVKQLGVSEISKELTIHKTTAFRILKTLEYIGWLEQAENSKYQLSTRVLRFASGIKKNWSIKEAISAEMETLHKKYNENVILTTIIENIGIWVNMIKSTHVLSEDIESGYSVPLHIGATGKTLLAFKGEAFRKTFFEDHAAEIRKTLGQAQLSKDIKAILAKGYCISSSEVTEGVTAVAVPILGKNRELLYGLTISGPSSRFPENIIESMKKDLLEIAENLHKELQQ
jgi:transcriptional regulator